MRSTPERFDGVQARATLDDAPIQRDALAGADDDDVAGMHVVGMRADDLAVALEVRRVGADVHKLADGLPAPVLRDALEQLSHLEEQHDEDGLGEHRLAAGDEPDQQGAHSRQGHEEVLVKGVTFRDVFDGLRQRLSPDDEVAGQEDDKLRPERHLD